MVGFPFRNKPNNSDQSYETYLDFLGLFLRENPSYCKVTQTSLDHCSLVEGVGWGGGGESQVREHGLCACMER